MKRTQLGSTLAQYLLALLFILLLIGFYYWKNGEGRIGHVTRLGDTYDRIVFVRQDADGRTNLYTIKADGSGLQRLTDSKSAKRAPAWAPDGKQLCYVGEPEQGGQDSHASQIFLLGSGDPKQATFGSIAKDLPQWRPDGKQIAFLANGGIKVMDPNGSNADQIYPTPHHDTSEESGNATGSDSTAADDPLHRPPLRQFAWSPDSRYIAAVLIQEGEYASVPGRGGWWHSDEAPTPEARQQQSQQSQAMLPEAVLMLPMSPPDKPFSPRGAMANKVGFSWFPDNSHLAVTLTGSLKKHVVAVYQREEQGVLPNILFLGSGYTAAAQAPAVSPDGKRIAFEVWRMNSAEDQEEIGITVLPLDIGRPIVVQSVADVAKIPLVIKGKATSPQWSQDGTRLLYSMVGPEARRDLWVAHADGSNPVNLTRGQGDNFDPAWSPARPSH